MRVLGLNCDAFVVAEMEETDSRCSLELRRRLSRCRFLVSTSKDDDENHNRGGQQRDNSN